MKTSVLPRLLLGLLLLLAPAGARAQTLFVGSVGNGASGQGSINTFDLNGNLITSGLVTGLDYPSALAVSGGNLYVANYSSGAIGKYDFAGSGAGAWVSGLVQPVAVSVAGGDVFVGTSDGTIRRYDTAGSLLDSFSTGLDTMTDMIVSGSSVFAAGNQTSMQSEVRVLDVGGGSELTLVGNLNQPGGLAYDGSTLYYFTQTTGFPSLYTVWSLNGETPNVLVNNSINAATGMTLWGSELFVTSVGGTATGDPARVGIYSLDNSTYDATFISSDLLLQSPYAIAIGGTPVPEPSTYAMIAGLAMLGFAAWRRQRRTAA